MLRETRGQRQVILYGAFDRYNYGDNLMPILLEMYFMQKHPEKYKCFDFVFSSIKGSDLSRFDCKPSVAMAQLLDVVEGSTVIVVGGEVLGADIGTLYMHVQDNKLIYRTLRAIRRFSHGAIIKIARNRYKSVWDYPYIPNKSSFSNNVKVVYNTVGGTPDITQIKVLESADYISVRDDRTYKALSGIPSRHLVPDSVLMVSKIADMNFISSKVRDEIRDLLENKKIITVQACPYKVKFTERELADELSTIAGNKNYTVILLPIGYASGHDDALFLRKVKNCTENDFILLDDLTVWEIMYVIANSDVFYGTSLHGVITAMSFGVSHFCINSDITKLVSFLETWSVAPFTKPIGVTQMAEVLDEITDESISNMKVSVERAQKIIFDSLDDISKIL
ncbi:polysaccharide pyruvyl transferase family protein [Serratia liquefaciens]|uniref:polysaccharide pyruvyl transferase family protein n=1 Tax=Serratia liquefaciens TaxID=614 RepID=UPI001F5E0262|nr:polysaccharide pyruvyl transferase family protein [Serratia liquefaciens]